MSQAPSSVSAAAPDFEERRATLQLALIPGVGPRTYRALREVFGTAQAALQAPAHALEQVPGVGPRIGRRIHAARDLAAADRELRICREQGIGVVIEPDAEYPDPLREIPDPPIALFCQGAWQVTDTLALAIVGTRHASHYGRRQAEKLASGLARVGLTIVSGLARGIDATAHRATLGVGGRTIAVLGSGLLNVYPPEHTALAAEIRAAGGVLLSELPPRQQPQSGTFPQRNRLISGLSLGVLVIEAARRSGALITASHAGTQGRDVLALPGPVDSRTSRGCHHLIRDGARLVESTEDILGELGPMFQVVPSLQGEIHHPAELQLNDQERCVLDAVSNQPVEIDQVIVRSGLPVPRVLATLSALEIRHLVERVGGSRVVRR